jgi:hypothetical protein
VDDSLPDSDDEDLNGNDPFPIPGVGIINRSLKEPIKEFRLNEVTDFFA